VSWRRNWLRLAPALPPGPARHGIARVCGASSATMGCRCDQENAATATIVGNGLQAVLT
jgi:hypothetical protein